MEGMLKDRREWVNDFKTNNNNKVPDEIKPFYERLNVETPLSPEEEEAKAAAEEDGGKKGKKKKEEKKKGKKGKGKKGKGGGDDEGAQVIKIGTSEIVQKFDEQYDDYNENWVNRDETENYKQQHDTELAKTEVMPLLEEEYKASVDAMINVELENMKLLYGSSKKKKKGKKKKKKGKKKKKKGIKLPGFKMIKDMLPPEVLTDLIRNDIVKKLPPQNLTDFIGEFNYIHSMLDDIKETLYDPSLALIRQLVTEYIIFPLGSELVRNRVLESIKSFLFYGPAGTGKTLIVRACATETNSLLFDISPANIDGKYADVKKAEEKLIASVMVTAKEYQPSIIYIDEMEKVMPAKKKGKKGKKGGKKKKNDPSNPTRIKKVLAKWTKKFMSHETRITIIGCTSMPEEGSKKEFKKFFDKTIYFPFPDYTTRRLMWKNFIEKHNGRLKSDFPLSTLAHISAGYSAGSIQRTCKKVLTDYRIKYQEQRPLVLQEFIGPLSLCE
jgi:SpoVK/Ycf46/Vps4 family AAA+-type ATPase